MLSVMDFLVKNECKTPILLGYDLFLQGCHLQGVAVGVLHELKVRFMI